MKTPSQEMKSYALDPNKLGKKPKKPSAKFRSKMDSQVASRIAVDKQNQNEKKKSGLSRYMTKFQHAGVAVFSLFLIGILGFLYFWSQSTGSPVNEPLAEATVPMKFESKIAAQISKKRAIGKKKPTLLSYAPRWESVRFDRRVKGLRGD